MMSLDKCTGCTYLHSSTGHQEEKIPLYYMPMLTAVFDGLGERAGMKYTATKSFLRHYKMRTCA